MSLKKNLLPLRTSREISCLQVHTIMEDCPDSQIKVDLKDSIIKEALNTGVDLRQYSLQIEQQLQEVILN